MCEGSTCTGNDGIRQKAKSTAGGLAPVDAAYLFDSKESALFSGLIMAFGRAHGANLPWVGTPARPLQGSRQQSLTVREVFRMVEGDQKSRELIEVVNDSLTTSMSFGLSHLSLSISGCRLEAVRVSAPIFTPACDNLYHSVASERRCRATLAVQAASPSMRAAVGSRGVFFFPRSGPSIRSFATRSLGAHRPCDNQDGPGSPHRCSWYMCAWEFSGWPTRGP